MRYSGDPQTNLVQKQKIYIQNCSTFHINFGKIMRESI